MKCRKNVQLKFDTRCETTGQMKLQVLQELGHKGPATNEQQMDHQQLTHK